MTKSEFWKDPNAPLALDCELADVISRFVWRWQNEGVIRLTAKLNTSGFETTFAICPRAEQHMRLLVLLASGECDEAKRQIYSLPRGLKRTDNSFARRTQLRSLASKSRLIYFGSLQEVNVSHLTKKRCRQCLQPSCLTSYAVFRVAGSNQCLVHFFAYARP